MPDSLAGLEQQRASLLSQILGLGDFRSGSITAIKGRRENQTAIAMSPDSRVTGRTSV